MKNEVTYKCKNCGAERKELIVKAGFLPLLAVGLFVLWVVCMSFGLRFGMEVAVTEQVNKGWGLFAFLATFIPFFLGVFVERFSDRNSEVCICAAVVAEDGRIARGHRHGDCFQHIANEWKIKPKIDVDGQGFITSRNRFVTRSEGRKLQEAAGIESADKEDGYRGHTLFSEDLY
jgi:hypothetical protein